MIFAAEIAILATLIFTWKSIQFIQMTSLV
jgi:hypothetical protein